MLLSNMDHHRSSFPPCNTTSSCVSSTTTYHSFHDDALYEPASPPRRTRAQTDVDRQRRRGSGSDHASSSCDERPLTATAMKRQDSGYGGSNGATPRSSNSYSRSPPQGPARRISNASVQQPSSRPRTRPSTRRSAKSYHHPPSVSMVASPSGMNPGAPASSYFSSRPPSQHYNHQASSYVHFPSPDPLEPTDVNRPRMSSVSSPPSPSASVVQLPPQPIHYWTSDRTRRLEYAAIDAASRGIKGWFRRNLVPDCMLAGDDGHIAFDDDTGSVRRYRLELEEDGHDEKSRRGSHRSWQFWSPQR